MSYRIRAESWSDTAAGGGVRRAILGHLLELSESVALGGQHTVTAVVAHDHPALTTLDTPAGQTNLEGGKVLRLVTGPSRWTEHRIIEPTIQRPGLTRRIVAQSIWLDLGKRGIVTRYLGQGKRTGTFPMPGLTAREHWNQFLYPALVEGGMSYWALEMEVPATVEDQPVDVQYANDTPLSALLKIAQGLGALEMSWTGDDEAYTVVMQRQVGETASPIIARSQRNLLTIGYTESQGDQATRLYPIGVQHGEERATMGEAEWRLGGNPPTRAPHPTDPELELVTIVLKDEAGGPGPVQFAGQWESEPGQPEIGRPAYLLTWLTAPFTLAIWGTDPATQRITLLGPEGIEVPHEDWHRVRFVHPTTPPIVAGLQEVTYVDHPAMRDRYGVLAGHVEVPNVPPTTNLIHNGLMRIWDESAALPQSWTRVGVTVTRATAPGDWSTAKQSALCTFDADTERLISPIALSPGGSTGFLSFFTRLKVLSGRVRTRMHFRAVVIGPTGEVSPGPFDVFFPQGGAEGLPDVMNTALNTWQDIGVAALWDIDNYSQFIVGDMEVSVEVMRAVGETVPAVVLVDSVQVTNTSDRRPLLEGSAGVRLFQAGNEHLRRYAEPAISVDANLLDLTTLDPERYPYDAFVLGGGVQVIDPETGVNVLTRITGWQRDWLRQTNTKVTISSARADLASMLARPASASARR